MLLIILLNIVQFIKSHVRDMNASEVYNEFDIILTLSENPVVIYYVEK